MQSHLSLTEFEWFVCRPLSYPDTDVLLICFSIANPDSLGNVVDKWVPEVSHFCPRIPFILVGTKKDLRSDPAVIEDLSLLKQKPVTTEQGQEMATLVNAHAYVECSARTREGVQQVFETAALAALHKHKSRRTPRAKCRILWLCLKPEQLHDFLYWYLLSIFLITTCLSSLIENSLQVRYCAVMFTSQYNMCTHDCWDTDHP